MRIIATLVGVCLALCATAQDSPYATEWSGKSAEDLTYYANKGDITAQRMLANAFLTGEKGVVKNETEAAGWFLKAANQGDGLSQYILGILHDEGKGVPRSLPEAINWYRKAATNGIPGAQFNLAVCYDRGEGVPVDKAEAMRWFQKAAEQGDAKAQSKLGLALITGSSGMQRNPTEAATWLRKAAYQSDAIAAFFLGRLYQEGEGVVKSDEDAATWFKRAADEGHADGMYFYAKALMDGRGVVKNQSSGRDYMLKAAERKQPEALKYVAELNRFTGERTTFSAGIPVESRATASFAAGPGITNPIVNSPTAPLTTAPSFATTSPGSTDTRSSAFSTAPKSAGTFSTSPPGASSFSSGPGIAAKSTSLPSFMGGDKTDSPKSSSFASSPGGKGFSSNPSGTPAFVQTKTASETKLPSFMSGTGDSGTKTGGFSSGPGGNATTPKTGSSFKGFSSGPSAGEPGKFSALGGGDSKPAFMSGGGTPSPTENGAPKGPKSTAELLAEINKMKERFSHGAGESSGTVEPPTPPTTSATEAASSPAFMSPPAKSTGELPSTFEPVVRTQSIDNSGTAGAAFPVALAWMTLGMATVMVVISIMFYITFKVRLRGLEGEIKKAQFELSKANVNLSAMMHQVEQLALQAPQNSSREGNEGGSNELMSLPDWDDEDVQEQTETSFKISRAR